MVPLGFPRLGRSWRSRSWPQRARSCDWFWIPGNLSPMTATRVGVIMGSDSDLPTMQAAVDALQTFGIAHEVRIVSAHRTPEWLVEYAQSAVARGIQVIIAGAGGAAHLPGMVASMTRLPVIGVPVPLAHMDGMDSLLSIVQMPAGVPVATVGVGNARNAGLLAARILGVHDEEIAKQLDLLRDDTARQVREKDAALQNKSENAE